MDNRVYWLWLQQVFGAGSPMPMKLNSQYAGGVREFFEGGPKLWSSRRDLNDAAAMAMRDFSIEEAGARLEYAQKVGWQVLTPDCPGYPEPLKNIPDPPAALFLKGKLPDLSEFLSVAVVGSRKPLPVSESAASLFGYQLAAAGAVVVSGGAVGVDTAALEGALRVPGCKAVSVLPVSLDSQYIHKNNRLRAVILSHGGTLLTEYFSQQNPERGAFPIRNRLITGLSRGVVIVQAAAKGGGLLYASRALEQNRDVFVYPGPQGTKEFAGSAKLLEDGAGAVTSGEDVLAEYENPAFHRPPSPETVELFRDFEFPPTEEEPAAAGLEDVGAGLSPTSRRVWEVLGPEPVSVARLAEETGLSSSALLGVLTELEIDGLAHSLPGKRYTRGRGV